MRLQRISENRKTRLSCMPHWRTRGLTRNAAITQAVKDCIEEGILVEFMKNHGVEVANMLYTQWDYDEAVSVEREEAYEEGREAGKAIGIAIGIAEGKAEGMT